MALTETLLIAAAPENVWALIDDPAQLSRWMPDVVAVTYPNGRDAKDPVGTRFVQTVREAAGEKTYDGVVTGFETGQFLAIDLTDAMVKIAVSYRLSPHANGTRLDYTGDLAMRHPLMGMMALAAWPMARTILLRQIAELKRVAELPEPAAKPAQKTGRNPPAKKAPGKKRKAGA